MKCPFLCYRNESEVAEDVSNKTSELFQRLFAREMKDFFHLSLRLTADAEKAESCLILAMKECLEGDCTVSEKWTRTWARRAVIRNAIRLLMGAEKATRDNVFGNTEFDFHPQPREQGIEALEESPAIFDLPDFDRLVFAICVLERYSVLDCALLMCKSPKEVDEARVRAITQVKAGEQSRIKGSSTFNTSTYGICGCGKEERDGPCGSLLD